MNKQTKFPELIPVTESSQLPLEVFSTITEIYFQHILCYISILTEMLPQGTQKTPGRQGIVKSAECPVSPIKVLLIRAVRAERDVADPSRMLLGGLKSFRKMSPIDP